MTNVAVPAAKIWPMMKALQGRGEAPCNPRGMFCLGLEDPWVVKKTPARPGGHRRARIGGKHQSQSSRRAETSPSGERLVRERRQSRLGKKEEIHVLACAARSADVQIALRPSASIDSRAVSHRDARRRRTPEAAHATLRAAENGKTREETIEGHTEETAAVPAVLHPGGLGGKRDRPRCPVTAERGAADQTDMIIDNRVGQITGKMSSGGRWSAHPVRDASSIDDGACGNEMRAGAWRAGNRGWGASGLQCRAAGPGTRKRGTAGPALRFVRPKWLGLR
ncbi:hypothetical protein B0H15DRAFT_577794 [Mycena belliarum]|uniref:Uncharacterized protein n=1 Tax=Mycena belliarum TaxID=1033014 RepID=A0AAD6TU72_9AGAR|nr:hypothetical protein B0H15DRAFT_577794 [Mycena belliae]